jgi:hypothetical protein
MTSVRTRIRKDLTRAMRLLEEVEREVVVYMDGDLDLVGLAEAAEVLGVAPGVVSSRRARGAFPEPIATLKCGPIWHRSDIEALDIRTTARRTST